MTTPHGRHFLFLLALPLLLARCSSDTPPPDAPIDDAGADVPAMADVSQDRSLDGTAPDDTATDGGPDGSSDQAAPDSPAESACGPCESGVCKGTTCAECGRDEHCGGTTPRCDLANNVCVACLPGTTDNCPTGQYCQANFTCAPGCKGNSACASDVCGANHDCERCLSDLECAGGRVCGSGVCGAACDGPADCTGGFVCCNRHCVDATRDIGHCGSCGAACQVSQFCGTGGCDDVSFANICAHAKTTSILDGLAADDAAGALVQNALLATCVPAPAASSSAPGMAGPVNPSTGQPVIGGNHLLTAAGGDIVQRLVRYLEMSGAAPLRLVMGPTDWQYRTQGSGSDAGADAGSGDLVASLPYMQSTASHDLFAIELARDPASGTLSLVVFGQQPESTLAAAWYFANVILPNRATYTKSWYAFEWTGTPDAGPSNADSFQLKASGP